MVAILMILIQILLQVVSGKNAFLVVFPESINENSLSLNNLATSSNIKLVQDDKIELIINDSSDVIINFSPSLFLYNHFQKMSWHYGKAHYSYLQ